MTQGSHETYCGEQHTVENSGVTLTVEMPWMSAASPPGSSIEISANVTVRPQEVRGVGVALAKMVQWPANICFSCSDHSTWLCSLQPGKT